MPETASLQVKVTVTSVLFQPAPLAAGVRLPPIAGAVVSMLTVAGSVALLPALSTAVPGTGWLAPAVATVVGAVQVAMPERASAQVKVTVTSVLFQPAPFAGGVCAWLIVGDVLSI